MNGAELVLEITERQGIELDPVVLGAMHAIAAMGVRFAIDDFGVGFSSISYLRDIPVQIIKADGSLSQTIDTDERASALLRSVAHMGQSLGLDVIVEGIEREAQMAMLRDYERSSTPRATSCTGRCRSRPAQGRPREPARRRAAGRTGKSGWHPPRPLTRVSVAPRGRGGSRDGVGTALCPGRGRWG